MYKFLRTINLPFSELKTKAMVLSSNIKLNTEKNSRFGIELPSFTNEMDADLLQADVLNNEQERLKYELIDSKNTGSECAFVEI